MMSFLKNYIAYAFVFKILDFSENGTDLLNKKKSESYSQKNMI